MIQAIETKYKGYRFRSRTEARWAVAFDYLKIKFEYEVEGYKFNSGWYLPDFVLKNSILKMDIIVEIKGIEPNSRERNLAKECSQELDIPVIIAIGIPSYEDGKTLFFDPVGNIKEHTHHTLFHLFRPAWRTEFCDSLDKIVETLNNSADVAKAIDAARSARFER